MSRSIASSTLWQVASQLTMAVLSIVTVKCVAIALSTEAAGYYNSSYGFLQLFGILADFGLYAVAVREVSRSKDKVGTLGDVIALRTLILCVSLGIGLLLVWTNPLWRGTPFPLAVLAAAAVPFFTLLAGTLRVVFQVELKMRAVFVAEVSQRILALGIIAAFVLTGTRDSSDTGILLAFILAGGLGALLLFSLSYLFASRLMRIAPRWNPEGFKRLLVLAMPYGVAFLCTALYRQLDITLIALLRDDFELQNAMYGFAQRAAEMAFLFPTLLLNSTLPLLSRKHEAGEDTRRLLGKTLLAVLLASGSAALFAWFWGYPLMQLLTQEKFLSAAGQPGADTAFSLLALPVFFNGLILFSFYTLLTRHAWRPLVATLCMGAAISLASNFLLIPQMGFVGACYTSIAVHTLLAALLLPQALRAMPVRFSLRFTLQLAGYFALLALFLWFSEAFLTSPLRTVGGGLLACALAIGAVFGLRIHASLRQG